MIHFKFNKFAKIIFFIFGNSIVFPLFLNAQFISVYNSNQVSFRDSSNHIIENLKNYRINLDSIIKFENVPFDSIPGVNQEQLKFDLYINEENFNDSVLTRSPLIFFIHGGSWREGDKGFDLEKVRMILNKGYIFVSTNYRLSPNPPDTSNSSRVKFPAHLNDVTKAFAKVYQILPYIKGDTSKITVMGHSAGGNLALSLASMEGFLDSYGIPLNSIKAAINFDGGGIDIDSLMKSINGNYRTDFINAFGNTSEQWKQASPALNFKKDSTLANFLLICQDQPSRSKYSYEFSNLLLRAGLKSAVYLATGYDHNEIITKFCSNEDESTKIYTENIFKFIEESLKK